MAGLTPNFISSIRQAMDITLDPSLVENTPRLLDVLNRSDKLQKLLVRQDSRGYTLLHLAAERNQPESIKCLLIKEANPNVCSGNTKEVTPLHIAASLGHLACLQLLVQSGGDVLAFDNQQKTPLDYAASNGQELCLNYLHEEIARRETVEAQETEDVLSAVEQNLATDNIGSLSHWQVFNELFPLSVATGANLSPTETLLYRRCEVNNSQELVRVFGRLSKDIPLRLHEASLLHSAARYGHVELVRLLTEKVPQIALSVSSDGYNALHIAVGRHHLEVTKLLIDKQVRWMRKTRHLTSSDSATTAPIEGSGMESSLSHGAARFATPTMSGHTVLHFAVAVNNTECLSYILKYHRELQLNVDCCDCGYTPLHLAVFLNRIKSIELLLNKGANPNFRIDQNVADSLSFCRTPLAEAALNKSTEAVNILLDHGAEDRHHDAIKKCMPYSRHSELIISLLASLVKHDDAYKPSKPLRKEHRKDHRRHKYALLEWTNLGLTEILPHWVVGCLPRVNFLRSLEISRQMECVTTVNLSNNRLHTVPPELFYLPKMSFLNLMSNELEALPELELVFNRLEDAYQWPCHALSKVYLHKNSLRSLPEFLFSLPNLVHLDLSNNQLQKLPFDLWKAPRLHTLICSFNQIEAIPTNWPHVLNSCKVENISLPRPATEEKIEDSVSPTVPSPTSSERVKEKRSSGEDRDSNPGAPLISKLHDRLNISNAHLPVDWEGGDGKDEVFEGLAFLNLSNNVISQVPENFPCLCPKLVRLDLSHNQISSISFPHCFPSGLKQLNLSHNQLEVIDCQNTMSKPLPCTNPQALSEASNVIYLDDVSFCVHRSHAQLAKLGMLEITHCELERINLFCPGPRSKQTEEPKKSHYRAEVVADPSGKPKQASTAQSRLVCPALTRLILHHNQLIKVPESVCEMVSLNSLDLSHNDIIDLPAEMGNLSNLWEFPLAGLKLISPPQNIIERGKTKDIIGFLWSLLQRARPYHRMKLMLVGRAARGKTTLLAKISEKGQRGVKDNWGNSRIKGANRDISTVGIVVSDWTYFKRVKESQTALKSITFMTWDFGGQEEYYATHQCFLSRRSLYLAVWNVTHGMKGAEELKPWLLNIQARAPNSPVIIAGTHSDKLNRSGRQELNRCVTFIDQNYGNDRSRKDGFPLIMASVVVSCVTGRNINFLRDKIFDVASQVRENTVAGRGIVVGARVSEYRLLMDQLVPASYLQLEDTVRNIALNMRLAGNPPVLTYKMLRNEVFTDPSTLINKNSGSRELEQAIRFLHDNGTMLHYEDPLLSDFYFVDPQWLCDMLAHIVTVREINPLVKDGVMRIADFPLIFNDIEFPIRWKTKYIRLLTTFEVAVELGQDQLLIPSALPQHKPNLPQAAVPEELKQLPPLHHAYIVPFIPSGFWPRLMSRLLTDNSILELAREGCAVPMEDSDQLTWVKWRTGMILQYGNLTLLSIEELKEGLFPHLTDGKGIKVFTEEQWQKHNMNSHIYGINIELPDIYPILKFPEAMKKYKRVNQLTRKVGKSVSTIPCAKVDIHVENTEKGRTKSTPSSDSHVTVPANRVVHIDQIDSEFEKLCTRVDNSRSSSTSSSQGQGGVGVILEATNGRISPIPPPVSAGACGTTPTSGRLHNKNYDSPTSKPTSPSSQLPQPLLTSIQHSSSSNSHANTLKVSEDKNDKMRAGLLSKTLDHISLLMEDWFVGVRPRTLIVPCPFCSLGVTPPVRMQRSYSEVEDLLPKAEREERGLEPRDDRSGPFQGSLAVLKSGVEAYPHSKHPHAYLSVDNETAAFNYAYRYNDCVVASRRLNSMYCPAHGEIPLEYMAPDTLFLTQGKDILVDAKDLEKKDMIGHGAFASVFRANYKNGQEVAVKAMTKEWRTLSQEQRGDDMGRGGDDGAMYNEESDSHGRPLRPTSRHSIINGFTNVKKELSILSPLKHPHVVRLFGVMLRPMGLVLELAPKASLKKILTYYQEVHARIQARAMQRVLLQVASAIQYLHKCKIIYRDLKSDNVLVWKFPEPHDLIPIPLGSEMGTESVQVKLSDYGISQFVVTQGVKGFVGTPGYIAPEILRYHGKEVYNQQVDIFSFGMFIYELLTLHIPYESLAAQLANQANEQGTRPSLAKRDFPCPVLVRELMVWCWQQLPDNRPTADDIITMATMHQFARLVDGIRICNTGQITATCMSLVNPGRYLVQRRGSRVLSPPPSSITGIPSLTLSNPDNSSLQVLSEEDYHHSDNLFGRESLEDNQTAESAKRGGSLGDVVSPSSVVVEKSPTRRGSGDLAGHVSHHTSPYLQRQYSSGGERHMMRRTSPGLLGEEESPKCEIWVASSNAFHSTVTVIDYTHRFANIEDVEVGDSPVLCLCLVKRKVWVGMEMGSLVVYNADTRKPYLQAWIKHYRKIQCILHLPPLHLVYLGLDDGSVLAYRDELPSQPLVSLDPTLTTPPLISLSPVQQFRDSTQSSSVMLVLPKPRTNSSNQSSKQDSDSPSKGLFELWVGQKENRISVLDAASLEVVKFLHNPLDKSSMPSYISYLSCSHLVSAYDPARGVACGKGEGTGDYVNVYSVSYHGQYVTRWDAETKKAVDSFDCRTHSGEGDTGDWSITALLYVNQELYVGLSSGLILILDPLSFAPICSLSCHRGQISSLLSLNASVLNQQGHASTRDLAPPPSQGSCPSSTSSSENNPSPTNMMSRSPSLSSVQPLPPPSLNVGNRLLSFGSGFKSYYDCPDVKQQHDSGFLLVWEADDWRATSSTSGTTL